MPNTLDILLVEDDLDARANLCDILDLDGHRVSVAGTIKEARELAVVEEFAVVILDRRLPDGTADHLLAELNHMAPLTETIVVTGYADLESTISALQHGAADYILKPINPEQLRARLRRIVQRRQIELDLRQEQQFANRILNTAEAVILVLDLNGNIVQFNPYFQRITGWSLAELRGENWFERCIPPQDHEWLREVFVETATETEISGIINSVLTKDGNRCQIRWSNSTLKDETGAATSVLSVGVDVTDLLDAQNRALRSQRLAAIGQTMAALAHESRNALQRIQSGLEMLSLEISEDSVARRDLGTIDRATRDLNELLEEVRSFAGPIHLHFETTNLADIWRRAWNHLEKSRENRDAQLTESLGGPELIHEVDALRLEMVFRNLFENALAACSDPAKISVVCDQSDRQCIHITVSDNGSGLNAHQREKLFEPFFTTKSAGTGLGMSISQRIIEAHGGTLTIGQSDDACGASFVIRIPMLTHGSV